MTFVLLFRWDSILSRTDVTLQVLIGSATFSDPSAPGYNAIVTDFINQIQTRMTAFINSRSSADSLAITNDFTFDVYIQPARQCCCANSINLSC